MTLNPHDGNRETGDCSPLFTNWQLFDRRKTSVVEGQTWVCGSARCVDGGKGGGMHFRQLPFPVPMWHIFGATSWP
jgi:hypothetical protein